ncbi:MAG: DUF5791 family protein [Haloplanus sp.]
MLRGEIDVDEATGPEDLVEAYGAVLRDTVDRLGVDAVVEETGLDTGTVDSLLDGAVGSVTLSDAAAVLGVDPDRSDAETIAAEARDVLLLGMTTAVVDVDTLSSALDASLEPKEIQQKIEGRHPMTLREYATIHYELREHTE